LPKLLKLLALLGCLALAVLGGLLPGVGWLLLVLAFHILVSEFETGRDWVKGARRRWAGPVALHSPGAGSPLGAAAAAPLRRPHESCEMRGGFRRVTTRTILPTSRSGPARAERV